MAFQGNPKYYRIIEGIRDFEQMPWLATRYAKDMAPGDGVLIWKSGDNAGIYAVAEIIESLKIIISPPDIGYWIDTSRVGIKPCTKIRFTSKLLDKPLLKEALKLDAVLKTLTVIRQPNSTKYKVTQQQWLRVYELKSEG